MREFSLLEQVNKNIHNCRKCRLCQTARNSVPGEGNADSKLVFIGEAPGAEEDATGRPFVGRAGKLLEKLLYSIGYRREDVWIGNIIKHRPPGNRDPLPDEISACAPYLKIQLEEIKPLLAVTLGRFAMNYFYKEGKITLDHGRVVKTPEYYIYPVYHPAAALRNREMLAVLAGDFKKIPAVLEETEKRIISNVGNKRTDNGQLGLF